MRGHVIEGLLQARLRSLGPNLESYLLISSSRDTVWEEKAACVLGWDLGVLKQHGTSPSVMGKLFYGGKLVDFKPFRLSHSLTLRYN